MKIQIIWLNQKMVAVLPDVPTSFATTVLESVLSVDGCRVARYWCQVVQATVQ
jgi:hypothetical protein